MIFTSSELRNGVTDTGYVLMFTQADLDGLPVKAVVQDRDGDACQKDYSPSPFRDRLNPETLWFIAGHENPQTPNLPAAHIWDPAMTSARKAQVTP